MAGGFNQPREGRNDDKAHPPIHPVAYAASSVLESEQHRKVYEFIVRRFLACCSDDAKGVSTTVEIEYGMEEFHAHGLIVLERNYLDVYPYDMWESSQQLPTFSVGEEFEPTEANIFEGKTAAPNYLTEPELIALMDANGIGTDATMAEHIAKIKERQYVVLQPRGGGGQLPDNADSTAAAPRGTRGRGRGVRGGGNGSSAIQEFIPTTLGVALVQGYDSLAFETSLSKPHLRKEVCPSCSYL